MSELRDDQHVAYLCIVCGAVIDGLGPTQTTNAPRPIGWDYDPAKSLEDNAIEFAVRQNAQANETLILAHVEAEHSIKDVLICLGTARNALQEILGILDGAIPCEGHPATAVTEAAKRGLGKG